MNARFGTGTGVDRAIESWLDLGPTKLSSVAIERTRGEVHRTRRRRPGWSAPTWLGWRGHRIGTRLALAAIVVAVVAGGVRLTLVPSIGNHPSPSVSPSASPSATPSPPIRPLSFGGSFVFEGTYTTQFEPALTLAVDQVVERDCGTTARAAGQCHGAVDINQGPTLDLEFGVENGSEVIVVAPDKVYDDSAAPRLIDPPADLVAWMRSLHGTAVLGEPTPVSIGGVAGNAFDVTKAGDLQFAKVSSNGFVAGFGPSGLRVIVLRVHGQLVLIEEWLGPANTTRDVPAVLQELQPLIDSIVWL